MTLHVAIHTKQWDDARCAIRGLQFDVAAGEFVAIVGPSGAGKSTLLKIIGGLDTRYDGQVTLPAATRLGTMFQEPRLMPWLTVQQNLRLVRPDATREHLHALLGSVGLQAYADHFPNQLSGGMQRRVALLRAFMVEPQLLLLDEPFQSLDAPTAAQLRTLLQDLCRHRQPSVLFVTHSLPEALALASRVLFLSAGPSRVILDWRVDLPAGRCIESPAVLDLAAQLLVRHPGLLSGGVQTAPTA